MELTKMQFIAWHFTKATLEKLGYTNVDLLDLTGEDRQFQYCFYDLHLTTNKGKVEASVRLWDTKVSADGELSLSHEANVSIKGKLKSFCALNANPTSVVCQILKVA